MLQPFRSGARPASLAGTAMPLTTLFRRTDSARATELKPSRPGIMTIRRESAWDHAGRISPVGFGLLLGGAAAGWHLIWALAVSAGWGPRVVSLLLWLHVTRPVQGTEGAGEGFLLLLTGPAAAIGFALGYVLARLWNRLG